MLLIVWNNHWGSYPYANNAYAIFACSQFFFERLVLLMPKSAFTEAHKIAIETLTNARKEVAMHQADLAKALGKDQSFISNIERGQRRVDMIEFYAICQVLNVDSAGLYAEIVQKLPKEIDI